MNYNHEDQGNYSHNEVAALKRRIAELERQLADREAERLVNEDRPDVKFSRVLPNYRPPAPPPPPANRLVRENAKPPGKETP